MFERNLEQLFVTPSGPNTEVLLVIEDPAGARSRERLQFVGRDLDEVVRRVADHLVRRGDVDTVARVRLRRDSGGALRDDETLRSRFVGYFERARRR